MSGDQDRGSGKNRNRIRTLRMASMIGVALVTLSVLLGVYFPDVVHERVFDPGPFGTLGTLGLVMALGLGGAVVVVGWRVLGEYLLDNVRRDGRPTRAAWVVLVVGLVATIGGFTAAAATGSPEPRLCPQVAYPDSGFGTAVTYDGLEYVLTMVDNNPPAGGGVAARAPLGEWFVVHGTVTNIGDYQRQFTGSSLCVKVCHATYSPDEGLSTQPTDLNPGLTADVALVYDVPVGFPSGDPVVIRIGGVSVDVPWDGSEGSR